MFLEPRIHHHGNNSIGWIEVVCGSMFSGKTEELIRRVNRALIAQQVVKIFKPAIDQRYHQVEVVSHNKNAVLSYPVAVARDILPHIHECNVVAIDEAQFFDAGLVEVCEKIANHGKRVIISGLDMDYKGHPFGPIPALLCMAEYVTKLHAICQRCGDVAHYSFRLLDAEDTVLLGEKAEYEPRCRSCFVEGMRQKAADKIQKKIDFER